MYDVSALWVDLLLRLAAAVVCGGILGWDRETRTKPAGFRTNILVALGGALFTILGMELSAQVRAAGGVNSDPVRVIAGIVGGIGFLGAATVIRGRRDVQGVTTAATIWLVAGVGVACGTGAFTLAFLATGIALFTLTVLGVAAATVNGRTNLEVESRHEDTPDA